MFSSLSEFCRQHCCHEKAGYTSWHVVQSDVTELNWSDAVYVLTN